MKNQKNVKLYKSIGYFFKKMNVAHIINPVNIGEKSDLFKAQPVTFNTMKVAKMFSKQNNNIYQYVIGYKEDEPIFPVDFIQLPNLTKSVMDYGSFKTLRKLPLIKDILFSLKESKEIDYVVYTNVDIALMPYFYDYLFEKINNGSDSLIINRRVIHENENLSYMFAEIGDSHPGYDCFVFRRELLNKFDLGNVCIGANWVGRAMIANLILYSDKLEIITDAHLTYHIGEDGAWLVENFSEFDLHNKKEVYDILHELKKKCTNNTKQNKIDEIIKFMDDWESPLLNERKISIKEKIIFKLIQILKKL